jgi:3-hydroxyisobutyrate dehydrogenase/2-hydroxy-3-oxopropionate reductase
MKKIGFIGMGVMGKSMARNLMTARYEVAIYDLFKEHCGDIIGEGAAWSETAAECATGRDAVVTMLGGPPDVEKVYFGDGGILSAANPGTYLIDMTTSDPELSKRIYAEAKKKGFHAMEAPVSGGDVGAREAKLAIMAGGDEDDFRTCMPLFEAMGKTIVYEGGPGSGQHVKMANQIAMAGALAALCEAVTYSVKAGIDVNKMIETISMGAAASWQLSNTVPRMLSGDFESGFFIKHYIKDLKIALANADRNGASMDVTNVVARIYQKLADDGMAGKGSQSLIKYYENPERYR